MPSRMVTVANPLRAVLFRYQSTEKLTCGHMVPRAEHYRRRARCPFCGQAKTEAVLAKKLGYRA